MNFFTIPDTCFPLGRYTPHVVAAIASPAQAKRQATLVAAEDVTHAEIDWMKARRALSQ